MNIYGLMKVLFICFSSRIRRFGAGGGGPACHPEQQRGAVNVLKLLRVWSAARTRGMEAADQRSELS